MLTTGVDSQDTLWNVIAPILLARKSLPSQDARYYWELALLTYKVCFEITGVRPTADIALNWAVNMAKNREYAEALFELALMLECGEVPL